MSAARGPILLVASALLASGCPATTRIVHRCPEPQACRVGPGDGVAGDTGSRQPDAKTGYRFKMPRYFQLPTTLGRPASISFSPKGDVVALGGRWGRLQLVRARDGKALLTLGHTDELVRGLLVRFSPDGLRLASARHRLRAVRLWSPQSGKLLREIIAQGYPIRDMTLTADHRVLLATGAGVEVWSARDGRHERTLKMRYDLPVTRLATSGAGLALAGDRAGNVLLFQPSNGVRHGRLLSPGKRLAALDLAPDGTLAAVAYDNGLVRLASTSPFRPVRGFSWYAKSAPVRVRVAPRKGKIVVAESSGVITHVDTERGKLLYRQRSRAKLLEDAELSRDGQLLASVSGAGAVEIWQSEDARRQLWLPNRVPSRAPRLPKATVRVMRPVRIDIETPGVDLTSFSLGRRGRFLAIAGKPTQVQVFYLVIWPRKDRAPYARLLHLLKPREQPRSRVARQPLFVTITPNRRYVIAQGAGFYLQRWSLRSGRRRKKRFKKKPLLRSLLPTHDSRRLITVGAGRRVYGWTPRGKRRFRFEGIADPYWIGVSPRGRTFVQVQGWDRIVAFSLPSGRKKWDRPSGPLADFEVVAMRFSRDSQQLLTFHRTGFLRYYDTVTGGLIKRRRLLHSGATNHCDIRPDGRVMACVVGRDVTLLELPSGALVRSIPLVRASEPPPRARAIGYSQRGNTLVVQTGRQKLTVLNFDRPGTETRYTGIDKAVRVKLGLPLTPPRVEVKPGQVTGHGVGTGPGSLRDRKPRPRK